jgi:hypothetical protein
MQAETIEVEERSKAYSTKRCCKQLYCIGSRSCVRYSNSDRLHAVQSILDRVKNLINGLTIVCKFSFRCSDLLETLPDRRYM